MNEMKSLADQLRSKMAKPDTPESNKIESPKKKASKPASVPQVVQLLRDYNIDGNKSMVHARFDAQTSQMLTHFKMATGVEVTRLVAFAVSKLIEQYPEIKSIVKQYIQDIKL